MLRCDPSLSLSISLTHASTHTMLHCDPPSLSPSLSLSLSLSLSQTQRAKLCIWILKLITKHTVADSDAPDCQSKVRMTSSPRFTKRSSIKCVAVLLQVILMIPKCIYFRRSYKVLSLSHRNTQRLPDTAASTLLQLLKQAFFLYSQNIFFCFNPCI